MECPTVSIRSLVASNLRNAAPGCASRLSEITSRPHTCAGAAPRGSDASMPYAAGSPLPL